MIQRPNNGGRCDMPMNGNVTVTVTANESANGIGSVITVTTVTVATVIAVVIVVTAANAASGLKGSDHGEQTVLPPPQGLPVLG